MVAPVKRSERELVMALFNAEAKGLVKHADSLRKTLARKRDEKKAGRILAAHKRWATIKANRAKAQEAASAL